MDRFNVVIINLYDILEPVNLLIHIYGLYLVWIGLYLGQISPNSGEK